KTTGGWELPLYLVEGTHTYQFVVDGQLLSDNNNVNRLPDGHGGFNSVVKIGKPRHFILTGHTDAKQVVLSGSFNNWREDELIMNKINTGWELNYTLGPGNYEYKFRVDGKWLADPSNPLTNSKETSWLIIEPNYTFHLKGFEQAKTVLVAGDFNNWNPEAFPMLKEGDEWVFSVHLSVGKHLYKFLVDKKWIIDPTNRFWEQNEYNTGNSIVWIDK
ncbi:MAG: hypothetical protein ABIS01_02895, partial [Ferruginibacter sp.]